MTEASEVFVKGAEAPWKDLGGGIRRQILGFDETVMMVRVAFDRGAIGALHHHPHVQCTLVESGSFDVTIDGRTRRLAAGDSFRVPPNAEHGCVAVEAGCLLDVFTPMREDFLS